MTTTTGETPAEQPYPVAVAAIANAWYARRVNGPDAARSRAQSAFTMTSLAAGLVFAALLAKINQMSTWVKLAGVVGLVLWLLATGLYLRAVATPFDERLPDIDNTKEFLGGASALAEKERKSIDGPLNIANILACGAAIVTVVALSATIFHSTVQRVEITPTPGEQVVLSAVCGHSIVTLTGSVDSESIGTDGIRIRPDACGSVSHLVLAPGDIDVLVLK